MTTVIMRVEFAHLRFVALHTCQPLARKKTAKAKENVAGILEKLDQYKKLNPAQPPARHRAAPDHRRPSTSRRHACGSVCHRDGRRGTAFRTGWHAGSWS